MATIKFAKEALLESLKLLSEELAKANEWVKDQGKTILLDVPEPFDHSLGHDPTGRVAGGGCGTDACGDVGIFLAIFTKMSSAPTKASKAGRRAKRRN